MILAFVETLQKISALETELANLKAQIAVYALSESQEQQVPLPPPPPPPPPPTAMTAKVSDFIHIHEQCVYMYFYILGVWHVVFTISVCSIQGKALNEMISGSDLSAAAPDMSLRTGFNSSASVINTPAKPQMVDVLKDIGSVRLRTVNAVK